jgi:hypothetical protein
MTTKAEVPKIDWTAEHVRCPFCHTVNFHNDPRWRTKPKDRGPLPNGQWDTGPFYDPLSPTTCMHCRRVVK